MHKKKTGLENKLTKSNKGGKRLNSGRKKADYETKTISFRVRLGFVEPIKRWSKIMFRSSLKVTHNVKRLGIAWLMRKEFSAT